MARTSESSDVSVKQAPARDIPSEGDVRKTAPAGIEIEPAQMVDPEWAAMMAFMAEKVEVMVHESADPLAPNPIEFGVNGEMFRFFRGKRQTVPRYIVAKMADTKKTTFSQQKVRDENGNESYRMVPHTVVQDPFAITRDDNPRGADWLAHVLAQQG